MLSATSPQTAEARISAALQLLSTIPDKTDLLLTLEKILTQYPLVSGLKNL